MRKTFHKMLAVLDGKPVGMRGQSMVELTLTMPIFIIMLIGLVEVGYFANNYLILTDVVRAAGRFGSIRDPLEWPEGDEKALHRLDCDVLDGGGASTFNVIGTEDPPLTSFPKTMPSAFINDPGYETQDLGYYDGVACAAIANMPPLEFNNEEDDIIVSVFGYAVLPNCGGGSPCVRVAGRYPAGQNECADDEFDPFDVNRNRVIDAGEDNTRIDRVSVPFDTEGFRGYTFRANQIPSNDDSCFGSEFSTGWMEEQLNRTLTEVDLTQLLANDEIQELSDFGLVLVEMRWNSYQLLGLPFFSWVGDPIVIHVWSIFPVSAAEPDLD